MKSDHEFDTGQWQPGARTNGADFHSSDIGNAERLNAAYGDELVFVSGLGWHVWDGQHWALDEGEARKCAHEIARKLYAETLDGKMDATARWARQSGTRPRLDAMLNEAKPHLSIPAADLDNQPTLLNVANGIIDLTTTDLLDHDKRLFLSKTSPVEFDSTAACPVFDGFLSDILPDQAVRRFIQEFTGYTLFGHQNEQCLAFLYGAGSNGKTTLLEAIGHIAGNYATALPFDSLLINTNTATRPQPEIVKLRGARMAMASEPDKNKWLSETIIKTLTGGDHVSARLLYSNDLIEFVNIATLWLAGNHKPKVSGTDLGIWRRIHLIPFNETIAESKRDKMLAAKLRQEASGILNWALEGARIYAEQGGLTVPEQVQVASKGYREENDPLALFIDDAVQDAPTSSVQSSIVYAGYEKHCKANDIEAMSHKRFATLFVEHGYTKERLAGKVWFRKIELINGYEQQIRPAAETL